jgi:hypothetical protein
VPRISGNLEPYSRNVSRIHSELSYKIPVPEPMSIGIRDGSASRARQKTGLYPRSWVQRKSRASVSRGASERERREASLLANGIAVPFLTRGTALKSNRGGFMLLRHVAPWYCRAEKVQRYFLPSGVRVEPEQTVADSAALEGERKTVTALFADIKRSTELTRDLDPEEARAIPFFNPL